MRRAILFAGFFGVEALNSRRGTSEKQADRQPEISGTEGATVRPWRLRLASIVPTEDWLVVGGVLSIKILLCVFGAKSFRILKNKSLQGRCGWLEVWNRCDMIHYLQAAEERRARIQEIQEIARIV